MRNRGGVARILGILRNFFAPEAAGAKRQQVMRFSQIRPAGQPIGEFFVECDLLRRRAESILEMGAGFPEHCISVLRRYHAVRPGRGTTLVMASSRRSLMLHEVAANVRRLFGSRGGGGRQDVLITEEAFRPFGQR